MAAGNDPGPTLQLFRAPTDNDKGFGKWLARDWREAGLTNLTRTQETFTDQKLDASTWEIRVVNRYETKTGGYRLITRWQVHSDGTLETDNQFTPFGELPAALPRVGLVWNLAPELETVRWLGRGPWENYADRLDATDMGVWQSTVSDQYVPYVRPQENGNKETVQWVTLTDATGKGLWLATQGNPFAFSALHFTTADLAGARHNYELHPRPEVVLSLDAKMSGLGNSSCGPGVLQKYAVPPVTYALKLRLSPAVAR
ncbi:MAG TPA: beta-galactosidase small subunit [Verrucomicrobiae bacterium]